MKRELIVVMALMCCSAHSVRLTLRERNVIQQINNPIYSFFVPINRNHISALNCIFQTRLQYQLRTPLECDYHELDEAARNLTDKLISQTTKNPNCIDNFLSLQFLLENPTVLGGRESEITELLRRLKDTGNMYAAALLCIHRSQRIFGMDHDKEQFQTYTNRIDEVFPIIQTLLETLFETLDENEMAYCTENIALMDLAYAGREWDSDDISVEPRISVRLAEHIERLLKQLLSNLTPNNEMLFKKLTTDQTRYPDAFIGKIHRLIAKHADAGDIKAIKLHYGFSSDWQDEMPDEEAAEIRRLNLMLIDVTRFKDSAKFVQLLELSNGYFIEPFRQRTFQAGIVDNALKTVLDSPSEQSLHVLRFIMKYPKLAIQIEAMKYRIMRILKILEGDGYIDATKLIYEWTHDWNAMPQEMAEKLNRIVVVNNRDEFEHNRESIQNDLRGIDETYAREIRKLTVDFFANFPDPDESPGFYIKSKSRRQAEAPTFKFPIRRDFLGDYSIPTIGS
ncbi:MAG: hypothetical protein LBQ43_00585, partial [Holosporales bacterium]|nr:hypothetical protein [Holosporales bacterium]